MYEKCSAWTYGRRMRASRATCSSPRPCPGLCWCWAWIWNRTSWAAADASSCANWVGPAAPLADRRLWERLASASPVLVCSEAPAPVSAPSSGASLDPCRCPTSCLQTAVRSLGPATARTSRCSRPTATPDRPQLLQDHSTLLQGNTNPKAQEDLWCKTSPARRCSRSPLKQTTDSRIQLLWVEEINLCNCPRITVTLGF